ncbi:MAG: ParA family protein [Christensenellales bacterium]|jgi:chromosome partitioning protein
MGKIVAVANQKGGVGKTTTAINLSACLALAGVPVLLVDLDPQANATSGLGLSKSRETSIYDVLINERPVKEVAASSNIPKLDVLPGNIALAGAEVEMVGLMARERLLKTALDEVIDDYKFIIIDCPPSLGLLTLNALTAADSIIVPIQCEYFALEGLSQLMNTVTQVKKHLNPQLEIEGVVLTMYDVRTKLSNQVVNEVKKFFKAKVYRSIVPRTIRLGEAPSYGMPVVAYAPSSSGAKAYQSLAKEVLKDNRGV